MIPTLNSKAPTFAIPNQDGKSVSLSNFKGKWLVLYFYPKDDTPGCTVEAIEFSKMKKDFAKENAEIAGISPDSEKSHCSFIEKQSLTITLLSDTDKKTLQAYGVWGQKKFMGREYMGVLRTTFLIDPQGVIKHIWENVTVKGHAEDVLKTLKGVK